jgi:hypothetical protein
MKLRCGSVITFLIGAWPTFLTCRLRGWGGKGCVVAGLSRVRCGFGVADSEIKVFRSFWNDSYPQRACARRKRPNKMR